MQHIATLNSFLLFIYLDTFSITYDCDLHKLKLALYFQVSEGCFWGIFASDWYFFVWWGFQVLIINKVKRTSPSKVCADYSIMSLFSLFLQFLMSSSLINP